MIVMIRLDLLLLWRLLRAQFSRRSDVVLVFVGLPILAFAAIELFRDLPEQLGNEPPWLCAMVGIVLSGPIGHAANRRIKWHQEHSLLSRFALSPHNVAAYRFATLSPTIPILIWLLVGLSSQRATEGAVWLMAGFAVAPWVSLFLENLVAHATPVIGAGQSRSRILPVRLHFSTTRAGRIRDQWASLTFSRMLDYRKVLLSMFALGIAFGTGFGLLLSSTLSAGDSTALIGLVSALGLFINARQFPATLRYLRQNGVHPRAVILGQLLTGTALALALMSGLALTSPYWHDQVMAVGICLAGFIWIAAMRALHFATKPRLVADAAFQLDLLALIVVGLAFAPAALLLVPSRILMLSRTAKANLWKLP